MRLPGYRASAPALNLATFLAAIVIFWRVAGLMPSRAGRSVTAKVPKPTSLNFLTCYQCILNSLKGSVKSQFGICVGKICLLGNLLY